tara:strand:+ start:1446 stop:2231 length:786 start_codon:yes stop_codon:yes gene_type:complete
MSTLRVDNIKGRTATTVNVPSGETFAVAGNQTVGGNVTVTGSLTVSGGGTFSTTGAVTCGDLTVNGTTTTINSTTLSVDDKNIELGSVSSPSDTTAAGGGITLKGATDKTFLWDSTSLNWTPTPGFTVQHTQEPVKAVSNASASDFTITYNYASDTENVFFISANETGNFTLALTNLPTTLGKAYTFTFFINPASSKTCRPKDITINGGSASDVPIRWAGSTAPTNMSTNGDEDIHTLTVLRRPDTAGWMAFCNFAMGMGS